MSPYYFIGPALLVIATIMFVVLVKRSLKKCPLCRAMTIDFRDMIGPDKGTLVNALEVSAFDLETPRGLVVCEACHTVFDCRPRERICRTLEHAFDAYSEVGNRSDSDGMVLPLNTIHCCVCGSPATESDAFSLTEAEKDFAYLQLRRVAGELSDRPAYLCRKCGTVNIWQKVPDSLYYSLTTHPNLERYPEAEYILEAKKRAAYMEEISLGNAIWSFNPDTIVAKPPSFAKDPFGICNLAGEFVISRTAGTITCGKKKKTRAWPLDDSWQVITETFSTRTQLWEEATGVEKTIGTAAQVKLFSRKHKMCFIMHVAQKYACQAVAEKIRRTLGLVTRDEITTSGKDPGEIFQTGPRRVPGA